MPTIAIKKQRYGRGDAFWLYKSANQTLAIASRIEQLLEAKNKNNIATAEDEEKQKEAEAEKLLQQIRKEQIKRKKVTKKDGEK